MSKCEKLYNKMKPKLSNASLTLDKFCNKYYTSEASFTTLYNFIKKRKETASTEMLWWKGEFPENSTGEFFKEYVCGDNTYLWAVNTYWCKQASNPNITDPIILKDYEGTYTIENNNYVDLASINVADTADKLDVFFPKLDQNPVYKKYSNIQLVHTTGQKFDLYNGESKIPNSEIEFSGDKKQFNFKIVSIITGVGKKEDESTPSINTNVDSVPSTPANNSSTNNSSSNNSNTGQVKVVKNIFNFPDVKDNQPGYVSPESNTQDCKDFPFKLGCVNDVIGDINEKFFGKGHRRANVFTKELLRALVSSALIDTDDKDPKITQEIYDIILKNSKKNVIKESVKKVLKEYINKKK